MKTFLTIIYVSIMTASIGQTNAQLPYREIPDYPEKYSAGTVAARVVEGLGFRFYWATEGLRKEDLKYQPAGELSGEARTTEETIQHIYGLTTTTLNSVKGLPNIAGSVDFNLPFEEVRRKTLDNIKQTADIFRNASENDFDKMKIIFQNDKGTREFPIWNILNGPIDDALWHVGQVITFRRSSGNPYNNKASVFTGKVSP